jgi:DNA polymerase
MFRIQKSEPAPSARDFLPERVTLRSLKTAATNCQGCPLFRHATQTVFGSGKTAARLILIGEQPGDHEDQEGKPFVGPAGRLLREVMAAAGIEMQDIYLTNAVKHFKWEPRGKRRLHAKPNSREINACKPWLEAEIEVIQPKMIVCLGATAAQSLLGRGFRLIASRGEVQHYANSFPVLATYHPSAVLRAPSETRGEMRQALLDDLRQAAELIAE